MKKIVFVLVGLVLVTIGFGQTKDPGISFENEVHNFGMIKEESGKVTHKFNFVNTGATPLLIRNVRATCGCTAPDWTKSPIPPGGKGYVAATYDPKGRPGAFSKYLYVDSNSGQPVRLTIQGEVAEKPRTIEDDYRNAMGDFRLKANHLAFGNLKNSEQKVYMLDVINTSSAEMKIDFQSVPQHIRVGLLAAGKDENQLVKDLKASFNSDTRVITGSLKPNERAKIVAVYDAVLKDDWGMLIDNFGVSINGQSDRNYRLVVSANIMEDFSKLTQEELANAPLANVDNPEVNFGKLSQTEKFEHEFVLKNEGKSDLYIRKIKACRKTWKSK